MNRHQHGNDQRQADAVQHVESQQRAFADERAAEQREPRVVGRVNQRDVAQPQQRCAGTFVTEERRRARHARTDGDRPDRELIPREEIAGERQQQRQHEHDDADRPVELARRLVRPGHEDAEHVQPHGDDHRVRAPPVHLAHDAERHVLAQPDDVGVGVLERRPVIEHQQQAGERQREKQKETQPAHAPRVAKLHARFPDSHRVQMQKNVRQHHEHAVAIGVRPLVPEDRRPHLCLRQPVPESGAGTFLRGNSFRISHLSSQLSAFGYQLAIGYRLSAFRLSGFQLPAYSAQLKAES